MKLTNKAYVVFGVPSDSSEHIVGTVDWDDDADPLAIKSAYKALEIFVADADMHADLMGVPKAEIELHDKKELFDD